MEVFTEQVTGHPIASSSLDSCNAENSQLETTQGIMGVSTSQWVHRENLLFSENVILW